MCDNCCEIYYYSHDFYCKIEIMHHHFSIFINDNFINVTEPDEEWGCLCDSCIKDILKKYGYKY